MFIHMLKRLVRSSYVASLQLMLFVAGCGSLPPVPMNAEAAQSRSAAAPQQAAPAQSTMQPPGEDPATMEPANKLPAPLYMLSASGQIYRVEQDGITRSQITFEVPANPDVPPITAFAVSPADGTLAYVVRAGNQDSLVLSEPLGPPRSALNFAPYRISDLVWSPDGRALAVRLDSDTPNMMPNGVYLVSPVYSEPGLFQADDPANSEQTNFSYAPVSWSPDGTQLLLKRFWKPVSYCDLAVKSVQNGARHAADRDGAPRFVLKGSAPGRNTARVDMGAYEAQSVIYVDQRATGNNTGTSWKNAFTDLQTAMQNDRTNLPIWVAAGTYTPTMDGDRAKTFLMGYGMSIYGGFAGTETAPSQRNSAANPTILSGDIGQPGDSSDNSYHVVTLINPIPNLARDCFGPCAYLDGVTISGGQADGFDENGKGGGIYSHDGPTLQLTNATISNNYARYGGGMYDDTSAAILTNVTISGNGADVGGGMSIAGASQPTLTNVVISGNEAFLGGGINNANTGSMKLTNVTISGNYGSDGGGINNVGASADQMIVRNSIVWGNTTRPDTQTPAQIAGPADVQYSLVQGGFAGTGNLDADPRFVAAVPTPGSTDGNLRLQPGSPAIDTGLNSALPLDVTTDRDGKQRIVDMPGIGSDAARAVGMGAYEAAAAQQDNDPTSTVPSLPLPSPTPVGSNAPSYSVYLPLSMR